METKFVIKFYYKKMIPRFLFCRIEDLRDIFSKFGCIKDVYIPRDYYSRVPRGFAYIEYSFHYNNNYLRPFLLFVISLTALLFPVIIFTFDSVQDAENAVRSSGRLRLFGKELEVEFAVGDRKSIYF